MKILALDVSDFWRSIRKTPDCWLWTDKTNGRGYGYKKIGKKTWVVHRLAWFLATGKDSDYLVLHRCDNPVCVRFKHLFEGTNQDNIRDRDMKGRQAKGESQGLHRLTEAQILKIRSLKAKGVSQTEIGHMFGVGQNHISRIVHRKNWKHV